jgi:hypothetical protein
VVAVAVLLVIRHRRSASAAVRLPAGARAAALAPGASAARAHVVSPVRVDAGVLYAPRHRTSDPGEAGVEVLDV